MAKLAHLLRVFPSPRGICAKSLLLTFCGMELLMAESREKPTATANPRALSHAREQSFSVGEMQKPDKSETLHWRNAPGQSPVNAPSLCCYVCQDGCNGELGFAHEAGQVRGYLLRPVARAPLTKLN
jgi:hypothetical protein